MTRVSTCCFSSLGWMRAFQAMTGLMFPAVIAGALYRSPGLYHPRRRAILHIKSLAKTKKQQQDFERKPPYCECGPMRMRTLHVLMLSTAVTSAGSYAPFLLLVSVFASNLKTR